MSIAQVYTDLQAAGALIAEELAILDKSGYAQTNGELYSTLRDIEIHHQGARLDKLSQLGAWCKNAEPLYRAYISLYTPQASVEKDIAYVSKRPLIRLRYFAKLLRAAGESNPGVAANTNFQGCLDILMALAVDAQHKMSLIDTSVRRPVGRLARSASPTPSVHISFHQVKNFDNLEPVAATFEPQSIDLTARFDFVLHHPSAGASGWPSIPVEAYILTGPSGGDSGLAVCSLEYGEQERELLFPVFRPGDLVLQPPPNCPEDDFMTLTCCLTCDRPKTVFMYPSPTCNFGLWRRRLGRMFPESAAKGQEYAQEHLYNHTTLVHRPSVISNRASRPTIVTEDDDIQLATEIRVEMLTASESGSSPRSTRSVTSSFSGLGISMPSSPEAPVSPKRDKTMSTSLSMKRLSKFDPQLDDGLAQAFTPSLLEQLKEFLLDVEGAVDGDGEPELDLSFDFKPPLALKGSDELDTVAFSEPLSFEPTFKSTSFEEPPIESLRQAQQVRHEIELEIMSKEHQREQVRRQDSVKAPPSRPPQIPLPTLQPYEPAEPVTPVDQIQRPLVPESVGRLFRRASAASTDSKSDDRPERRPSTLPPIDDIEGTGTALYPTKTSQESLSPSPDFQVETRPRAQPPVTRKKSLPALGSKPKVNAKPVYFPPAHTSPMFLDDSDDEESKPRFRQFVRRVSQPFLSLTKTKKANKAHAGPPSPEFFEAQPKTQDPPMPLLAPPSPPPSPPRSMSGSSLQSSMAADSSVTSFYTVNTSFSGSDGGLSGLAKDIAQTTAAALPQPNVVAIPQPAAAAAMATAVASDSHNCTVETGISASISSRSMARSSSSRSVDSELSSSSSAASGLASVLAYNNTSQTTIMAQEPVARTTAPKPAKILTLPLDPEPMPVSKSSSGNSLSRNGRFNLFQGTALVSQWKNSRWAPLCTSLLTIEVSLGDSGGVLTALTEAGDGFLALELAASDVVRKSTVLDIQLAQPSRGSTYMFRLRNAADQAKFFRALTDAKKDLLDQPLVYAQTVPRRPSFAPSMLSSTSSLGSLSSAVPGANMGLGSPYSPQSPFGSPYGSSSSLGSPSLLCGVNSLGGPEMLLVNSLKSKWLAKTYDGTWSKSSKTVRLSVFSVPGSTAKRLVVTENGSGRPVYEAQLPARCFNRSGRVGVTIRLDNSVDEGEVRYMLQFKGDKEARYINDLLASV